jgi:hypothetical protein
MKAVVITTIFPVTKAVKEFSKINDGRIIVVGDQKTPKDWACANTLYISPERQTELGFAIVKKLPWCHYTRKMIGYLVAMKDGAEEIAETDDDNLPRENWGFPAFSGEYLVSDPNKGFVNIYNYFTDSFIWPRGFPLRSIRNQPASNFENLKKTSCRVGIWQGMADADPDVDAIYRLTVGKECLFKNKEPVVFAEGTISPFNSQNTSFIKALFPLLYMPAYVTIRVTDILRGLVAQPIMWKAGYKLGFVGPTVYQERNEHDFLKDFEAEIPLYLRSDEIPKIVEAAISSANSVGDNLYSAYSALEREKMVVKDELILLEAWLKDVEALQ